MEELYEKYKESLELDEIAKKLFCKDTPKSKT